MRKDIQAPQVEGVAMAIVRDTDELGVISWNVYLVNQRDVALENVLISSRGYGELDGEARKTSELRHSIERLEAHEWAKIEPIVEDVFGLTNQYWLSFYLDNVLYDKKYIFLPESIQEEHFTEIPLMKVKGVMIG